MAVAIGVHLLILFALVGSTPNPPVTFEPNAVTVNLVELPPPPAPPAPAHSSGARKKAMARPAPATPAPRRPVRTAPTPLPASQNPAPAPAPELTEAQLAGAATAGSGGGAGSGNEGGACDMVRRLQNALRRDYQVQAAVAEARHTAGAATSAVMVWNGDWIRSASQDGKGLAGVRQAIIVEVGFAPKACRTQPVHGLVLISLNDAPGSARIVLGARDWRWSDLLFAR